MCSVYHASVVTEQHGGASFYSRDEKRYSPMSSNQRALPDAIISASPVSLSTSSDSCIGVLAMYGFRLAELADNLRPFICRWYSGNEDPIAIKSVAFVAYFDASRAPDWVGLNV